MHTGWMDAAPGYAGLPRGFYKKIATLFCPVLTELANAAAAGDILPSRFNEGIVALLFKTEGENPKPGDFRPISLLNSDYKIIAGALAARIKLVLAALVHETQTGFVPGRLIVENLTFNRDFFYWSKRTGSPLVVAFLDFEKAFDRVSWFYRDQVLTKMGCSILFIMVRR